MSVVPAPARQHRSRLRTIVVGMIASALSVGGILAAPLAHAAPTASATGTGTATESITVPAGLYRIDTAFSGNEDDGEATEFEALLLDGDGEVADLLASEVGSADQTARIFSIAEDTTFDVQVAAAPSAEWSVSFTTATAPAAAVTAVKTTGRGLNTSELYRLKAGTYQVTVTYRGNKYPGYDGTVGFYMYMDHEEYYWELLEDEGASGSATVLVTIPSGVYWFTPIGSGHSTWTIDAKALKTFTATPTPKISGKAKVGKKLKAKAGTWKPSGVKLSYQWYRGDSKIKGATKSSYKLTSKDKGKKIKVKVTGTKSGYVSVTKTSKATGKVAK